MSEANEPKGELVEKHFGLPVGLPRDPFQPLTQLWQTWDEKAPGGIDRLAKALRKADFTTDELRDQEILVEHVLVHGVELVNDDTGEVVSALRTVLISPDNSTAAFVSRGVLSSLPLLVRLYGPPPWNPVVKVRVREERTRRKFRTIVLEPVER